MALSLLALAQGQPSEFRGGSLLPFHLADTDGSCLTADGQMGACDERSLWTYLKRGSKKEGHSLVSFLEPMAEQSCLARSDCRKPKSALGPQKCGACGAKHWELVRDRTTLEPADAEATSLVNAMRDRGVLLSTDGPLHNVIKIKPPLVVDEGDVDMTLRLLDDVLAGLG